MHKAFITGGGGFVGLHLTKLLQDEGWEVHSYDLRNGHNLLNYEMLRNTLDIVRPTHIFHLAAQAYVPESFANPTRAVEVNLIGSINLLEAVKQLGIETKILLAGTSEEYGDTSEEEEPITELSLPNPLSPYSITKLAMDHMGRLYAESYGLNVVTTRAYNHTGPGRGEMYADSTWAKQIVDIERGNGKILEHGNLESVRNYNDVRDIVKAYTLAIELPSGVYNICGDQNVTMQEVLDILVKNAKVKIETKVNASRYRPSDFSFKKPSAKKFTDLTGWKPEITLETTLQDVLQSWRDR